MDNIHDLFNCHLFNRLLAMHLHLHFLYCETRRKAHKMYINRIKPGWTRRFTYEDIFI